ncbi:MAG: hypothetical protein WBM44_08330 [Waterburya sp.]
MSRKLGFLRAEGLVFASRYRYSRVRRSRLRGFLGGKQEEDEGVEAIREMVKTFPKKRRCSTDGLEKIAR